MAKLQFPPNPVTGTPYVAPNGITYVFDANIGVQGVWKAFESVPLVITFPGTISGSPQVGATLTYTPGIATGGYGAINLSWEWILASTGLRLPGTAVDDLNAIVPTVALGGRIFVRLTATDAALNTVTTDTSVFPTVPAVIAPEGIQNAVVPSTIPGTASFNWANVPGTLTASGCVEFSVDGGVSWGQASQAVTNSPPTAVLTRWVVNSSCGEAPNGTVLNGALSSGLLQSSFQFTIDRIPAAFGLAPSVVSTTPNTTTDGTSVFTLADANTAPLIWGAISGGPVNPQYSLDGISWNSLPAVPTIGISVPVGATVRVRATTGSTPGSGTLSVRAGASATSGQFESAILTIVAITTTFPNTVFSPTTGPNASPASTNTSTLKGTASTNASGWQDGSTFISTTGGLLYRIGAGSYDSISRQVLPGNSVDLIWDPAVVSAAADNALLTGTLTNGVFTNTYFLSVTRTPTGLSFGDINNQSLNTAVTSGIITPGGFNTPVNISIAGTGTNPLTSRGVSVQGGSFSAASQVVNPGQTLQLAGTTGGSSSTGYGAVVTMGSGPVVTTTWTATTSSVPPSIGKPSILLPANNSTGVGTAAGVTVTSNTYNPQGGAGAHTSSDWQLFANGYPLTSTSTITGVSSNTSAWTLRNVGVPTGWRINGLAFGDGVWVCAAWNPFGGGTPVAYQSGDDGASWTQLTIPSIPGGTPLRVVFGNGAWLIWPYKLQDQGVTGAWRVGSSAATAWSTLNNGTAAQPRMDIFYGGGQWVGSGGTPLGGGTTGRLVASTSGSPGGPYGVVNSQSLNVMGQIGQYGGGRWVYLGTFSNPDVNLAVSSTFGGSFSLINVAGASINPNNINQMWYGDNTFVAVGNSNTAYTSTDGFNWTSRNPQLGGQSAITATYGNGTWLIGGTTNSLSASTNNGVTWTPLNGPGFGSDGIFCSGYNPNTGVFMVAGGGGKLATSQVPGGATTLTIANAQADGFLVGNTIGSSPAGAGPGTIISLDNSQVVVSPASNTWGIGLALATDPSSYTQILNIVGSASLVSLAISKPPLVANTPYYVRVRYNATSPSAISSPYSNFNKFTTGSL